MNYPLGRTSKLGQLHKESWDNFSLLTASCLAVLPSFSHSHIWSSGTAGKDAVMSSIFFFFHRADRSGGGAPASPTTKRDTFTVVTCPFLMSFSLNSEDMTSSAQSTAWSLFYAN